VEAREIIFLLSLSFNRFCNYQNTRGQGNPQNIRSPPWPTFVFQSVLSILDGMEDVLAVGINGGNKAVAVGFPPISIANFGTSAC
jgi:hypothetical protein